MLRPCSHCGAPERHLRKGYCQACYRRWRRTGSLDAPTVLPPLSRGLISRLSTYAPESGCRTWRGTCDRDGYPIYFDSELWQKERRQSHIRVHRWLAQDLFGDIPDGQFVERSCGNRKCVAVGHLALVSHAQSQFTRAGVNVRKNHCDSGHDFDEGNAYINKAGKRICRTCQRRSAAAYRKKEVAFDARMRRTYGITAADIERLLAKQGDCCAICNTAFVFTEGKKNPIHVDHDHACCSGRTSCGACVRGLLCEGCNTGLGTFKDDLSRLQSAIDYVKRHRASGPMQGT
ncbi:endonuclease domain-containing protein [Streptomyces sp. NPDC045456]|uniref:endonuclease domain-containing protein n=1 Tax=Streptomyces sp. NPDC045456 TaxID=3155254 RepID=UPI0033EAEBAB